MLLNTTFIALYTLFSPAVINLTPDKNTKYFKNLAPIIYKDNAISKKKHVYIKVPTKIIKIDKNSN